MLYFAYGSNMLKERLCHPKRVPGARCLCIGYVTGRTLAFHKRSWDGSGKCDLALSSDPAARVYGVVYDVPENELWALDQAESVGAGYRRELIEVFSETQGRHMAETYLADPQFVDPRLLPYTWYKELVLHGARQNNLPDAALDWIERFPACPDPTPDRATAIEAAEAMQAFRQTAPTYG